MFRKDTFRLIKKTFNRFISLVLIVFIGVAFMMGLMSTETIMQNSVEKFYDETNLQDLQLYSSYGFCQEDLEAIKEISCVENAFASRFRDVFANCQDQEGLVARIREIDSDVNTYQLIEGRLPANNKEILVAQNTKLITIGDKVSFYLEDDDISEIINETEYTIVGIVSSSEYMTILLTTSTLNNLDTDVVFYLPNENFVSEYYSTIYLTIDGASDLNSFKDKYEELISQAKEDVEISASNQQGYMKDIVLKEYYEKIEEGKKTLEEEKENGQIQLELAKSDLEAAQLKIVLAEMEIESNETTLKSSEETLLAQESLLKKQEDIVNQAIRQIEQDQGRSFDEVYRDVETAYATYKSLEAAQGSPGVISNVALNALKNQNETLKASNEAYQARIEEKQLRLVEIEELLSSASDEEEIKNLENEKTIVQAEIDSLNQLIITNQETINYNNETIARLEAGEVEDYDRQIEEAMKQIDQEAGGSIEETYSQMKQLNDARKQIEEGKQQIADGKAQIADGKAQIAQAKKQIEAGKKQYQDGLIEYNKAVLRFDQEIEKAENDIRLAEQKLNELPSANWIILDRDMAYSAYMYKGSAQQMGSIGLVMPLLFYLVAALVCMTTMTRLIDEQRGQIGIFRALGFSKKEVICKYLVYAFLASIIGTFFGIFAGIAIFPTVIYKTWKLMYFTPEIVLSFPIKYVIISFLAFSSLMMIVTGLVVNKSLKEQPAQLMRPKAPRNAKKVFLEYITIIWKNLSFTSKITARNIIRYKTRFFMTVIGVAGCCSLLVLGYGIKDSISSVVTTQYEQFFNYDYTVYLNEDSQTTEIIEHLEDDLSNESVVGIMTYSSLIYKDDEELKAINVQVLDARKAGEIFNLFDYKSDDKLKLKNSGVIISKKYAKNHNIAPGDKIIIESKDGLKAEVEVSGVCEMYFQHYCFISQDLYEQLFESSVYYDTIAISSENSLQEITNELEGYAAISSIADFSSFIERFDVMIQALNVIIGVIILTAGSLAFVVLMNLTQVNISERIREIATLKVLGFRTKEVNSYIFKEIFLLTLIGAIAGLPLGNLEEGFVMTVIDMEMITFPHVIQPISYVYSLAITLTFSIIVMISMRKPLKEIEMIESLKSVE